MEAANPELSWGMAVLYRTNAQSRAIEESLVRWDSHRCGDCASTTGVRSRICWPICAADQPDTVSLLRVIVPKRGIGKTTIQRLTDAANQLGIPLWDVVSDPEAVRSLGGRSARGCCSSAIW